jgi:hypothetical protein
MERKSEVTMFAEHLLNQLKGRKPSSLSVEELEKMVRKTLNEAAPEAAKYGGWMLYQP